MTDNKGEASICWVSEVSKDGLTLTIECDNTGKKEKIVVSRRQVPLEPGKGRYVLLTRSGNDR